jgi:putative acetyltransferase
VRILKQHLEEQNSSISKFKNSKSRNPEIAQMTSLSIRKIQPADDPSLALIIRTSLTEFDANKPGTVYYDASTDHLYQLFQQPGSIYFVAEHGKNIIGGAGIYPSEGLPNGTCELVKMYLNKEHRGLGVGKLLIDKCLEFAKSAGYSQVYLETMPELEKAVTVYEKFGFQYLNGPLGNTGHYGCSVWMLKVL